MMEEIRTTVSRKLLLDAVALAGKFPHNSIPILNCVKVDIEENGNVVVRNTDLEVDIVSRLDGEGTGPISMVVSKKKLSETLKSLKEADVTLEYILGEKFDNKCPECGSIEYHVPKQALEQEEENGVLTPCPMPETKTLNFDDTVCTQCGYAGKTAEFVVPDIPTELKVGDFFSLSLNPEEVDEFPEAGNRPETEQAVITTAGNLRKVLSAAATDFEKAFSLGSVCFNADDALMISTDGHRMHMVGADVTCNMLVPAGVLKKLIAGKKDDAEITLSTEKQSPTLEVPEGLKKADLIELWKSHSGETLPASMTVADIREKMVRKPAEPKFAYMFDGTREITIRLLDGTFPDYKAVMNKPESSGTFNVKVGTLQEGMKQALALTTTDYMAVKVSFNGCIDLETEVAGDSYNRASVKIESGGIEPPVSHNYNARYIVNILSLFKGTDELVLTVPPGTTPLFFNDNAGFEALVMPTRAA